MSPANQMPEGLKLHFQMEIMCCHIKLKAKKVNDAWCHLDRAHLLSLRYPGAHSQVHLEMLKFGYTSQNYMLVISQLFKFCFAGLNSVLLAKRKSASILDQHCSKKSPDIQRILGYYL